MTNTALTVLEARYLKRDPRGEIVETPEALFQRVARSIAQAERTFGDSQAVDRWEEAFGEALTNLDFLPNSPTLMNAGSRLGQLSACFVLPVGDSMEEIFESLKLAALIQQPGPDGVRPSGTARYCLTCRHGSPRRALLLPENSRGNDAQEPHQ